MNKKINIILSYKIRFLSFLLMVFVVFMHSYNLGYSEFQPGNNAILNLNHIIQNYISQGITRIAVPLFFLISGIFYFLKFDLTSKIFLKKIKKRTKTLLIPYLLWSIIGFILFLALQINPLTARFFSDSRELIINYSFIQILDVIFIHPIAFQLWFIRDLFFLVLISPIIEVLNKYLKGYWLILFMAAWFFDLPIFIFRGNEPLLFFAFGGFVVRNKFDWLSTYFSFTTILISLILWFSINLFSALTFSDSIHIYLQMTHKIGIVIGVFSVWTIFDYIHKGQNITFFNSIFSMTFFLYVFHEPFLTIVRKLLLKVIGISELGLLVVYFSSAIIVTIVSVYIGLLLKKHVRRLYLVLTGGR